MALQLLDEPEIRNALALIMVPGAVHELRVLDGRERESGWPANWAGYYTDAGAIVRDLATLRGGWAAVYLTPNPCDPLLLHKSANALIKAKRGESTHDGQIVRRAWLLADFDPVIWGEAGEIKGIAANEAEHAAAHIRRDAVAAHLQADGFPAPIVADSGNGGHLMFRTDLPPASTLPERFIKACAAMWGDDPGSERAGWNRAATVKIDTSIANAARIWKLYGTLACKGAGVGDRPWRLARIVDTPPLGLEAIGELELQAWVDAAESRIAAAKAAAEPTPAAAPARAHGAALPPAPAPTHGGTFDALELVRSQGLQVGPPKRRADGATFYELDECACERKTHNKATVSIAESGAVGLQCVHESCKFSRTKASPGEHWRAWRSEHDPSYRPEGQASAVTSIERQAYAERLGQAAPQATPPSSPIDVSGLLGGAPITPPPPLERPKPPPTAPAQAKDGRQRINIAQDSRALREQVLAALAADRRLFVSHGKIARVASSRMVDLSAGSLDSAAVDACEFVTYRRDPVTGEFVAKPDSLPIRVRGMLEALDDEGAAKFRLVEQVTRSPFWTAAGVPITSAGYCSEAKTVLVEPPVLQDQPEPDGAACLQYLRELVADFPFQGGAGGAEVSNLIGAMLAPMVRPMISGPMPMLLIEGNIPGLGKSLLASMIRLIYGLESEAGSLPRDEERVQSLMLGILKKSEPVHVFDDVTHSVISATLNRAITGRTYSDRVLGVSDTASYVIRQLWIMTLNNARASADIVRRVFRCRLLWDRPGRPEERRDIRIRDFLGHVERNRVAILSRLWQLVAEWIAAGQPVPHDLPVLGSFECFASVIGGILRYAGDTAWLTNGAEVKEDLALDDEWSPFVLSWAHDSTLGTHWGRGYKPAVLWQFASNNGLLGSIIGQGGNEAAQVNRLASILKGKRDSCYHGWRITADKDERGQWLYRLQEIPKQGILALQ